MLSTILNLIALELRVQNLAALRRNSSNSRPALPTSKKANIIFLPTRRIAKPLKTPKA